MASRRIDPGALAIAALITLACGCAPAMPMMLGGRTTPQGRVDLGLGGAVRIPTGDLVPREMPVGAEELLAFAEPGGIVPVAWARWGFLRSWDAGLFVSGTTARLELIGGTSLSRFIRLIGGIAPYGGYAISETRQGVGGGEGWRVGGIAPLAIALDLGGLFEAWLGARVGFEHAEGMVGAESMRTAGNLTAFRAGAFLGLAVGLRRVHVVAELAADYEHWRGALGGVPIERQGLALTPGFALRLRF
ncbi:MAG: hypothetical protein M3Y87_10665 [Myxococcota bacterium]|nr:hypothetical protein [Myxococcota bacterium]